MPSLSVEGVSKSFGSNSVLRSVSFSLKEGDILGIIGPNGAGKTTLLNIISGFLKPDCGKVALDWLDITKLKPHMIRRLGIVRSFQIPKLAKNLTVLENVLASLLFDASKADLSEAKDRCVKVLEQLGLKDHLYDYPTILPSAGLKKLELARILASNAKVALFDEVTAGLSDDERKIMLNLIRSFHTEQRILVIVDHVLPTIIDLCPRVIVLDKGSIIAEGRPDDVLSNKYVIESYVGEIKYAKAK